MDPKGGRPEEIVGGLGERWEVMNIKVKFHAAMAALHGTIDCIAGLQERYPEHFADVSQIKGIESYVGEAAFGHGGWTVPEREELTSVAAQMSIAYAAAAQCVDGEVMMGQFAEGKLNRTEVVELMRKVTPILEESFKGATGWSTKVVVTFHDGTALEQTVQKPKFIDPGVSNAEVVEKWRRLVRGLRLERERMEGIEKLVLNMENEGGGVLERLAALLEERVGRAI